ncbi:aurora kinase A and ninein-interacting protein [Micropterus salmoides]|uniref:aurora kinase A and ninein-interacting protein n=1 Tax=Micropterus salmoides TaxID=27706 RepID=UPI0018ECF168|nr:aurora kinase A and ninein-interacting protein [Micropterus salmoides]
MKTSKPALQTSAQEECGVWLDTVQLKGKAKQKRLTRPISKLLNPFTGGGGYSLAVALNFTQTKLEIPKTKQSSISTFFTTQRRVLNKMSSSEVPNMDPVLPSSSSTSSTSSLTAPTPVASGTKRRREVDLEMFNLYNSEAEWQSENVPEPEAAVWQEQAASNTTSQNMDCEFKEEEFEEINPPQCKRRLTATSSVPGDSQPIPQAWSQDPLLSCSQYFESEFYPTNQKNNTAKNFSDSEPSFLNSLQSEEAFGILTDIEVRTSTQKSLKQFHSSQLDDEKENSRFLSSKSPSKHSTLSHIEPLSNHKWAEPKTASPRKHIPVHLWKKADKEESPDSQFKWTKQSSSPLKKLSAQQSCRAFDEDSLAMLFTQDSEGFRVIAHRGLQARSPFKDQSNISTGVVRSSAYKSLVEEDEEDEMLFTQDSQGNMVIKH